jgi:RNA polymerase sigma-70 factor (ECF subfamily)
MAGDAARRDDRSQERFLRLFLASERELLRYVAAVAPNADDAREIVQDTAVALWEKFDQYDASRPFTPWACRFALNISKQWLARQKRWRAILSDDLAGHLVRRRMELEADIDHRLRHLQGCLEKLPTPQRQLVDGYYSRQIGIDGLAAETRRSAEAIYKALQRTRHMLQKCIEQAVREEMAT